MAKTYATGYCLRETKKIRISGRESVLRLPGTDFTCFTGTKVPKMMDQWASICIYIHIYIYIYIYAYIYTARKSKITDAAVSGKFDTNRVKANLTRLV